MRPLERLLVEHIAAHGPIGFDEFQANALYAPGQGFYVAGGGAGRRRDFLTSPEVGPLFGAVLARALDAWWDELGRPERLHVIDAGAGPGGLARSLLAASPESGTALHLTLVEVGEAQWALHPGGVTSRADLPAPGELDGPVVVLANELLDNLPVALVERTDDGWQEVVVGLAVDGFAFGLRPLAPEQTAWCDQRIGPVPVGAQVPVQADAAAWLREALDLLAPRGGRVVVIDYARTSQELAALPRDAWLRTYADHGRAGGPLEEPGTCDITCDVAIDQLAAVREPAQRRTQHDFLTAHGIDELVAEGQAVWAEQGIGGGLAAIAGQSRAIEAEALLDPDGLGGFTVLEWW
ncbi:SAM-dependent methyltransferase [Aquihabitans sp. McL0605]|uniref:SAM-dependent methyltransferase n=1 Tax=Aquihabitans sp. McL0605 TaxID=3415671 RepID=UPI003CF6C6BA